MHQSEALLPSPPLREFVRQFVSVSGAVPHGRVVLPIIARTDVVLAFNLARRHQAFEYRTAAPRLLPAVLIVGPQTARRADLWLDDTWASFSIHFQPAAFQRLFHLPVQPFMDTAIDGGEVLGRDANTLHQRLQHAATPAERMRLAEAFLLRRADGAAAPHPVATSAAAILNSAGRISVRSASVTAGLSERHFERRFAELMGMPPKLFARISRVNYVLDLKNRRPGLTWAAIGQEAGYFDQTHLVKDFRAMAGQPPGSYLRASTAPRGGFLLSSPSLPA